MANSVLVRQRPSQSPFSATSLADFRFAILHRMAGRHRLTPNSRSAQWLDAHPVQHPWMTQIISTTIWGAITYLAITIFN